jgi:hypothetical protein
MQHTVRTKQALKQTQSSQLTTLQDPQSPQPKLRLSNPKLHLALWSLCAVMTAQAKNVPKLHPLVAAAMARQAASLATSQVLVVMANQVAMVVVTAAVKALRLVAHVWVMLLSVRNVMLWNQRKMHCVAWLHKPTVKC